MIWFTTSLKYYIYFILFIIPKKILSFFIFPLIYPFRHKVWKSMTAQYGDWQIDEALKQNKGWRLFVWLFLDDSCYSDCKTYWDNKLEDGKYLKWAKSEFLQAWYWNGIRNTSNNLTHLIAVKVFGKNQFIKKVEKQYCECELYKNKYLGYVSLIRFWTKSQER